MMQDSSPPTAKSNPSVPATEDRRWFIKIAAVLVGGLVGLVPVAAGLAVFFDPWRRQRKSTGLVRVASLDAVPDDDVPRLFAIVADRTDAWNHFVQQPLGAVYLIRKKGEQTPTAFTATCPHLGCFIGFEPVQRPLRLRLRGRQPLPGAGQDVFRCPCHTSAFALDGQVLAGPSPRPMDTLECEVKDGEVLVKFENFQTGTPQKIVKT